MKREEIKTKLLLEKNVRLIDIFKFNKRTYAKVLKINEHDIEYNYYEIREDTIEDIKDTEILKYLVQFNEIHFRNIIY